jgi:uncharacterized membrane protein
MKTQLILLIIVFVVFPTIYLTISDPYHLAGLMFSGFVVIFTTLFIYILKKDIEKIGEKK